MDIVTHAMMGGILASPYLATAPVEASCFMFGTVLPDMDALSRLFGKRAFLRAHQTASHSVLVQALAGLACGLALGPWAGIGLFAGLLLHSLLDASNTFGISLVWPLSKRRFCFEWVFFIDGWVIAASLAAMAGVLLTWHPDEGSATWVAAAYGGVLVAYWPAKAWLRHRAARIGPEGSLAYIPVAAVPWIYLGLRPVEGGVETFRFDALRGRVANRLLVEVLDPPYLEALAGVEEYRVMCQLTPAYHVVAADPTDGGTRLTLRDLRTRTMNTGFGRLEVDLDRAGRVSGVVFHV